MAEAAFIARAAMGVRAASGNAAGRAATRRRRRQMVRCRTAG